MYIIFFYHIIQLTDETIVYFSPLLSVNPTLRAFKVNWSRKD